MQGFDYEPIDDFLKERFLELIEQGFTRPEAAESLGQTGSRFRRLTNPMSDQYDEKFAKRYKALVIEGGLGKEALRERLESAAIDRALTSSDRILEKLLMIHDPAWADFKPGNARLEVTGEVLHRLLPTLPMEVLDQIEEKPELLRESLKGLPPG